MTCKREIKLLKEKIEVHKTNLNDIEKDIIYRNERIRIDKYEIRTHKYAIKNGKHIIKSMEKHLQEKEEKC